MSKIRSYRNMQKLKQKQSTGTYIIDDILAVMKDCLTSQTLLKKLNEIIYIKFILEDEGELNYLDA